MKRLDLKLMEKRFNIMSDNNQKETWIQYSYEDTENAAILQTAESKKQARKDDKIFPGNPWYQYDLVENKERQIEAINERGPFYFN